nr:P-selectin-like isoform X2 [Dromaius novaehollandiae]
MGTAMGQRSAARTRGLSCRGICYLGITAVTWGLIAQLEVGAWQYNYTEQKDYTWEQARNFCQTYFTDLVAIQNKNEIKYLNQWLPFHSRYYWIGIRKLNGTWTWVGTRKALTKEAENWAEKEPNNKGSNQDCVEIYIKRQRESGKWNDEPCSKRKRALCYQASCQPLPCSQRGECVETIGNYSCECQPGFHGRDCENVVACPVLSAPDWGELSCSHLHGNFSFGSTCTFSCQTGFVLTGTQSRQCTATGDWTGQPPQCEEDAASFFKQVLVYSSSTALVATGIVLSGALIILLVKRLSDKAQEKKKLLSPTSDLGSPGIFTNAAYDSNL